MKKEYILPKIGKIELNKSEAPGEKGIFGEYYLNIVNDKEGFFDTFEHMNSSIKDIEKKLSDYLISKRNKLLNEASELEELASKIKEKGLEKTSQYYQTLENKTEGGKK